MDRAMSPAEISLLNQRIVEMIADNSMSFNWIERPSTRRFFEVLRPSSVNCYELVLARNMKQAVLAKTRFFQVV